MPNLSEISDDEWAFAVPYLMLVSEDAGLRRYDLRKVYNGVRYHHDNRERCPALGARRDATGARNVVC